MTNQKKLKRKKVKLYKNNRGKKNESKVKNTRFVLFLQKFNENLILIMTKCSVKI